MGHFSKQASSDLFLPKWFCLVDTSQLPTKNKKIKKRNREKEGPKGKKTHRQKVLMDNWKEENW